MNMYCWSPTTTPETTVLICDSNTSSTHRRGSDGTSGSDTAFRSTARLLNLKPPLKFPTETLRTLHTPPKTGRPTPKRPRSLSKVESQCQADAIRHRRNHGHQVQVDAHGVVPGERSLLQAHLLADAGRIVVLLPVSRLCAQLSASEAHPMRDGLLRIRCSPWCVRAIIAAVVAGPYFARFASAVAPAKARSPASRGTRASARTLAGGYVKAVASSRRDCSWK